MYVDRYYITIKINNSLLSTTTLCSSLVVLQLVCFMFIFSLVVVSWNQLANLPYSLLVPSFYFSEHD